WPLRWPAAKNALLLDVELKVVLGAALHLGLQRRLRRVGIDRWKSRWKQAATGGQFRRLVGWIVFAESHRIFAGCCSIVRFGRGQFELSAFIGRAGGQPTLRARVGIE